jgi:hypothetical protein
MLDLLLSLRLAGANYWRRITNYYNGFCATVLMVFGLWASVGELFSPTSSSFPFTSSGPSLIRRLASDVVAFYRATAKERAAFAKMMANFVEQALQEPFCVYYLAGFVFMFELSRSSTPSLLKPSASWKIRRMSWRKSSVRWLGRGSRECVLFFLPLIEALSLAFSSLFRHQIPLQ